MIVQKLFTFILYILFLPILSFGENISRNYQLYDGIPLVNCAFDGDKVFQACLVDTGSYSSRLPPELFHKSKKYAGGEVNHTFTASGAISRCQALNLSSLEIDDLALNPTLVDKCDGSPRGIIGINAFDGSAWNFNLKAGLIQKSPDDLIRSRSLVRDSNGYAYVPIKIDGIHVNALFDTGITLGGAVDPIFVKENPNLFRFERKVNAQDPSGTIASYNVYTMKTVDFGEGHILKSVEVLVLEQPLMWKVFNSSGAPILLGMESLRHFDWHIDLKNNLWRIK